MVDREKDLETIAPKMPSHRRGLTLSGSRKSVTEELWSDSDLDTLRKLSYNSATTSSDDIVLGPATGPSKRDHHFQESRHASRTRRFIEATYNAFDVYPLNSFYWRVALGSVVGSTIWILSSLFSFLPKEFPSTRFRGETEYWVGVLSCSGTICFFISSLAVIIHTLNESRSRYDGWKAQQIRNEYRADRNLYKKNYRAGAWDWCPSWTDIKDHWCDDYGFRCCCIQLVCSVFFLEAGICSIPVIYEKISPSLGLMNAIYWAPKVFACVGFIWMGILGLIQSHRSERKTPFYRKLSWHAGVWSTLGGIGFLIMSFFGFGTKDWMKRQSGIASLWGSCAFMASSLLLIWKQTFKGRPQ